MYQFQQIISVQRAWRSEFPKINAPGRNVIMNITSHFEKTGSVGHVPPKPKKPSEKREAAKIQVKSMVSEFASLSIRKASSAHGISSTLVYHILHDDLHLKPYKFLQWHNLVDQDYEKRVNFA